MKLWTLLFVAYVVLAIAGTGGQRGAAIVAAIGAAVLALSRLPRFSHDTSMAFDIVGFGLLAGACGVVLGAGLT